jgi:hypothetical protein
MGCTGFQPRGVRHLSLSNLVGVADAFRAVGGFRLAIVQYSHLEVCHAQKLADTYNTLNGIDEVLADCCARLLEVH